MKPYSQLSATEQEAFRMGQEIVVDEVLSYIADLESTRNPLSSHGKAQLFILRELVRKMIE